ncbi:baseplate wedge subunit protein [Stenotrophomonas phage vB_SmaS-DLP_6]|nr:baseplate wedge subunit protein [Stenotrophomonas phage vB_SmaS-DLP_6]
MAIEKVISPYIASQLPRIYREEGPMFVSFLKAYYEFLEQSNGVLAESRNLLEYRDIDTTLPEFIVYFKNKYMTGVPDNLMGDSRTLQKHIKEIYGSKGTVRGLELVFRLLADQNIEVYYPGDDILKPSDGVWIKPTYLEVSVNAANVLLIGEQITGRESGATAIVEDFQLRYINRRQINVLYLSNVRGNFKTGELLLNPICEDPLQSPAVIGSMTNILVNESGFDYNVGDVLEVIGGSGILGKAVVSNTSPRSGSVEFAIRDGGSGYANDNIWAPTTVTVTAIDANNPGIGATFAIGRLGDTEIITTPVDTIAPYANVALGSADYGFPTFLSAENINTPLNQALNVQDITVGTILTLRAINPGAGYNGPVTVTVTNSVIGGLTILDPSRGNSVKGLNATINGEASAGRGAIDTVKILDAGLGYQEGDVVELRNANNSFIAGGTIALGREGVGEGYWKDTRSFLNSDKYIQDSFYYQEYSFEVRVALAFERYANIIKRLWQPAGTEAFGKYVVGEELDSGSFIEEVKIDAIFNTTYVTSYSTFIETSRQTLTMYDSMYATTYMTEKLTTTQRGTSTNLLDGIPERIVNGQFNLTIGGWTARGDTAASWDASGKMRLARGSTAGAAEQVFTTTVGRTYYVRGEFANNTGTGGNIIIASSNNTADAVANITKNGAANSFAFSFVANNTTMYVIPNTIGVANNAALWDNISVKELPEVTRNTVFDTVIATDTSRATTKSTNRDTSTIFDTNRVTNYITQQFTLSSFATNRSTTRMTASVYDTTFNTARTTNRLTDTVIGTIAPTNRATITAFNTTYATFYATNRATSTLGFTAYATNRITSALKDTIYDTSFATSRTTDTVVSTSRATNRLTDTTIATAFVTSFNTTYDTSRITNTAFDTNRSTVFGTTIVTSFVSQYATVFQTSRATETNRQTSRLTGTSAQVSRATGTSHVTFTSYNTTTVFPTRYITSYTNPGLSQYSVVFYETQVNTSRLTGTGHNTTTSYNTTTTYISSFNTTTTFSTGFATTTAYDTSQITSVNTSRNTTYDTSRITTFSTNRDTTTVYGTTYQTTQNTLRNTSYATTTAFVTTFNTAYATTTTYDTNRSTTRQTATTALTTFDTVIATTKITDTTFDTFTTTTRGTNRSTDTVYNTTIQTAYQTLTAFVTTFATNRSTQIATATVYDTAFETSTLRLTDVVTSRVTAYATNRLTATTFNTTYTTTFATNTAYATNRSTTFVDIPTTFQTFFLTATMAPTDYDTGYNTQRTTDTFYDTAYATARVTSVNTATDLTF